MKKIIVGAFLSLLIFTECSQVPVTGRRQLDLVPNSEILNQSFVQYDSFLMTHHVITGTAEAAMVDKVGKRLSKAVEEYFVSQNMTDVTKGYQWEYHLIEEKDANAWCMPGGKIVVYTGILPITKDESGLAVVLGHEISHAVAKHGNERMSQLLVAQLGGMALDVALSQKPQQTRELFNLAYGVTANYGVLLPYSRTQESEADKLGLIFMALAGYDPHSALTFWNRMSEMAGASPPEFLSDHPSNERRIKDIESNLPLAMKYYKPQ